MKRKHIVSKVILLTVLFLVSSLVHGENTKRYDIVVYGGTSAGVVTAIQASRMGKKVIIIEPSNRIGGLTTGGLGQTDIGNKFVFGGIAREFYKNISKHYKNQDNWKWQKKMDYKDGGQTTTDPNEETMWTFEPSAALKVLHQMLLKEKNIQLVYNQQLNRENGVKKTKNLISSISMESGETYGGEMFVDATYEGDLMAAAGVTYTVGRESIEQYGENLNGVQANDTSRSLVNTLSINGRNHNFIDGVDPYIRKGDSLSGLLPNINPKRPTKQGSGDKAIQAYCFRMCLTDFPGNKIDFVKPNAYSEKDYELLFRSFEAGETRIPWINSSMPNRKTDTNNCYGFSTDFIGQNYNYPEAGYKERKAIIERHKNYQQGLMWTLAYHPRIPSEIRNEVSKWGLCKDEFETGNGWQEQLYIREARRMQSDIVITQRHCEGLDGISDPVGMAAYGMDSHNVQRYVNANGFVKNEGNIECKLKSPFPISYRAIIPKENECGNLLVPTCPSATHIAFGSIRMEPVFMVLGQSAAIAACMAIDEGIALQKLRYSKLKANLLLFNQRLNAVKK